MCGAWVSRAVELVHTELDDRPAPISAATNLYKRTESAGSMRLYEKGCAAIAACDVSALAGSLEVYAWLCIYARVGNVLYSAREYVSGHSSLVLWASPGSPSSPSVRVR
jgi:hypothetical protein